MPEGFSASEWGALLDLGGSWEFESVATPTQENCCDCGPFTLGFASYIAKCIERKLPVLPGGYRRHPEAHHVRPDVRHARSVGGGTGLQSPVCSL